MTDRGGHLEAGDVELAQLRSGAVKVGLAALALAIALAGVIRIADAGKHRPEGIAERWLQAVSETGRSGLRADAIRRAEKIGPLSVAAPLLPPAAQRSSKENLFVDLEVGRAEVAGGVARVPFALHQYSRSGAHPARDGTLVLRRAGASWQVGALDARRPDEKVPSEGGAPPSRASVSAWFGAGALGFVIAGAASLLVRRAGRDQPPKPPKWDEATGGQGSRALASN